MAILSFRERALTALALLAFACCAVSCGQAGRANTAEFPELIIEGDDAETGNYDPSLEYAPDGTGWLAYSAVTGWPPDTVQTRIARSTDQGLTWTRVADVNRSAPASARFPGGAEVNGTWWHEVPTLVHDPEDAGREWKLFWHRYIARKAPRGPADRLFMFGWIATRHARSPEGPWSEETALIGAGLFPLPPFQTQFKIGDLHPELQSYIALSEPGSLFHEGVLYLSLQAARNPEREPNKHDKHDILLLASADHGGNWRYAGTLLRSEEAAGFGGDFFTGSSLAVENGRLFLLVCPEKPGRPGEDHRGTVIFEFDDISRGSLLRDAAGQPALVKRIDPILSMGGQSDYDERNSRGGIVMPQFDFGNLPRIFRLFNTGFRILR